ncbi:family 20 glycosylhydrolase [Roseivirga pacifica]|uniref:family 20 glycosylhydrolase n=1 Tax=Roseivirga pacifica TaxID=1267423 RepID=UPI00209461E6|nr:family 20 glycosylhydrolase [Roseivirga pacifica]MCO6359284.1 family 20 glycosylhydrolase [Roseivirga pacifica]MCO6366653.1 family 20 glycosylhydrolase [Roseivirga pacifica]MCO6370814.1 family 20 glycosylhydrolase [Roseivirga pacifica]MCO6374299.1 family 20 glycosylhydrolase [Roseivirga pacifica]MCO6379568.1 family 20 glycosylhydrolase [Roseivirga pacifica]
MTRTLALLTLIVVLQACNIKPETIQPNIVPEPQSMVIDDDQAYVITETPILAYDDDKAILTAEFLNEYLNSVGWKSQIAQNDEQPNISFELINGLEAEAYHFSVDDNGVHIQASTEKGFFYGVQTLLQLLPTDSHSANLPFMAIEDAPRFKWRGLHLDVSRHFFPVEFIKKYIDLMAFYKFNTFHWHLTDDQGWRIEIKQYPKLTEVGSQRKETMVEKNFNPYKGDGEPYGGFYTQEEIKEVVAYAEARQVTVVPEIEMPGHALAALAAYPELGCGPGPYEVGTIWGVYDDIFCPKEETFAFLENVLTEVMDLFPSKYIHVGGDEAPKTVWKKSAVAQRVIRREGLKDEFELQSYFIQRMEKFLNANGRQLIGWDEILEGGLAPGAAVMSWRGEAGGIEAAEAEHNVVMTPNGSMYFDYYQGNPETEPLAIGGMITLDKVYNYDPIPAELDEAHHKYILGAQANLWTEYIKTADHVEYMIYPRAVALSEVVWSQPEQRDWERFQQKLTKQYQLLDARNVNYHVSPPEGLSMGLTLENEVSLSLSSPYPNSSIYYTTDGSTPDENATKYTKPFTVKIDGAPVSVKAVTVLATGGKSPIATGVYQKAALKEAIQPLKADPGLQTTIHLGNFSSVNDLKGEGKTSVYEVIELPTPQPDQFGLVFQGMINVPTDGIYTFYTTSDDGSTLSVAGELVVNNDGLHGAQEASGQVALKAGYHNFEVKYFEAGGGESLLVAIAGPNMEKQAIPAEMLKH